MKCGRVTFPPRASWQAELLPESLEGRHCVRF